MLRDIPYAGYDGPARAGECAGLSGTQTEGWFVAPDVSVAVDGYRAFTAAIRQLGTRGIDGCREDRQRREGCRSVLHPRAEQGVIRIDRCFAPARRFCYVVALGGESQGTIVTLRLHYGGRSEPRIDAVEIEWPEISV